MSGRPALWDNGNVRRLGLVGAWLTVLVLTTTVTWQIVRAADDQVNERPAPLNVAAPVITDLTTSTQAGSTSTSVPDTTTTTVSSSTTTTQPESPTTTASPSTTAPGSSWQTRSVKTSGGTVVLKYRPGEVAYQAATPAAGFQVEVEKFGPPEVEVKLESESIEIEVHARWRDGDLDVDVSESDDD